MIQRKKFGRAVIDITLLLGQRRTNRLHKRNQTRRRSLDKARSGGEECRIGEADLPFRTHHGALCTWMGQPACCTWQHPTASNPCELCRTKSVLLRGNNRPEAMQGGGERPERGAGRFKSGGLGAYNGRRNRLMLTKCTRIDPIADTTDNAWLQCDEGRCFEGETAACTGA